MCYSQQLLATLVEYMPARWLYLSGVCFFIYKAFMYVYFSHWSKQNVPEWKSSFISFIYEMNKKPLHEMEQELYKSYGGLYGRYDGMTPVLTVSDPDLLKMIFVKDFHIFPNRRDMKFNDPIMDNTLFILEGYDWKRVRNTVSPALTSAKLKKMLPLLEECSTSLIESIAKTVKGNKDINCQRVFGAFTIDAIAKCAFGMNINSLEDENDPFAAKSKVLFQCRLGWRTLITMYLPFMMKWLRLSLLNPETTIFYRDIVRQLIDERKKIRGRDDFLQLLLDAENESDDPNNNDRSKCSEAACASGNTNIPTHTKPTKKRLSRDEILSQCVTFFIAGYEATTSLLSYAVYNLAMNEGYQAMAVSEIQSVLKKYDGEINYDSLSEMKYLEAVINECLRLCPSMVRSERRAEEDCVLGDTNIHLKKGMLISIPVYAIHRDPRYYPEPDMFKPERFYEPDTNRPQFVHLPFGAGPRLCLGLRFVQMQVKMCLAKLLMKFQISPAATTPADLKYIESRNILRVDNVQVSLSERTAPKQPESELSTLVRTLSKPQIACRTF